MAAAGPPPDRRPVHPGSTGRRAGRRLREWRQQPSSLAPVRRPRPARLMTPEDYMDVTLIARDAQSAGGPDPRVFDSERIPAAGGGAGRPARPQWEAPTLAAPPVVLPDFHHKSNMELPSSVAVATRTSVRPTLTSASVNCGMALIALNSPRPARAGIDEFYRRVRERYPYPPGMSTELSAQDVLGCARDGGAFAAERFGTGTSISRARRRAGTPGPRPLRRRGPAPARTARPRPAARAAEVRHGRPDQPLHRAAGGGGGLRSGYRGEARSRAGTDDPCSITRGGGVFSRGGRRDVRPQEALPEADPGGPCRW